MELIITSSGPIGLEKTIVHLTTRNGFLSVPGYTIVTRFGGVLQLVVHRDVTGSGWYLTESSTGLTTNRRYPTRKDAVKDLTPDVMARLATAFERVDVEFYRRKLREYLNTHAAPQK